MAKISNSMNEAFANLQNLFREKDGLKTMLKQLLRHAMEQEVEDHLGVGCRERSADRRGHRNGYKPRRMKTRVGELDLDVPHVRGCEPYHPSMFAKYIAAARDLCARYLEEIERWPELIEGSTDGGKYDVSRQIDAGPSQMQQPPAMLLDAA